MEDYATEYGRKIANIETLVKELQEVEYRNLGIEMGKDPRIPINVTLVWGIKVVR